MLDEKDCKDDLNHFSEKKFVEEHEFSSKDVEKIVRTPFERKPLDLSIFTFDEQLNDIFFNDTVNANEFEKIIEDEHLYFEEWSKVVCENLFGEDDEEFVRKRKKIRKRVRRVKNKLERGCAKMTKRLSSTKSSLKRTHWNDGKQVRLKRSRYGS